MIQNRIVLFAINNPFQSDVVESRLREAGISFENAKGSYKGQSEDIYIAIANEDTKLDVIRHIARLYKQESILIVNEERKSTLDFLNGETLNLEGLWHETNPETAKKLDAWTLTQGKYYTVS